MARLQILCANGCKLERIVNVFFLFTEFEDLCPRAKKFVLFDLDSVLWVDHYIVSCG